MNDETYLIRKREYLRHIDDKTRLYAMVKGLCHMVSELPNNRGNKELTELAAQFNTMAEEMFRGWCISKQYLLFHDEAGLAILMDNELVKPEAVGHMPCACRCCGCTEAGDSPNDASSGKPNDTFNGSMEVLGEVLQELLGDRVCIHIMEK